MKRGVSFPRFSVAVLGLALAGALCVVYAHGQQLGNGNATAGGLRYIEAGQPPVVIYPTVEAAQHARQGHGPPTSSGSNNLAYNGGTGGVGVETAPKVVLVLWGSQWNSNDPSGEEALVSSFLSGVGGSSWLNSVTQYCEGVPKGTIFCSSSGVKYTAAGNQTGMFTTTLSNNTEMINEIKDNAVPAPTHPKQSQIAAEAVHAAAVFAAATGGVDNSTTQYIIATATGNNSSGFGRQYCAYHGYTSSTTTGNVAYTYLPYITDAGASCGANFNGLGANAGITIVEGHELGETITDQFPSGGWLDSGGAENGDKCAWISSGQGAAADITLSTGKFAVQSLWSNAFNSDAGGCVMSY